MPVPSLSQPFVPAADPSLSKHNDDYGRKHNFNAGPSALPLPVLEQIQRELLNWRGTGASVMETSHRSKPFMNLMDEAKKAYRDLLDVPQTHEIIFPQAGGTGQTAAILFNSLNRAENEWAAYAVTGTWSQKAFAEAGKLNYRAETICDPNPKMLASPKTWATGPATANFAEECCSLSGSNDLNGNQAPSLVHHCNNETIAGMEYHLDPKDEAMKTLPSNWFNEEDGKTTVWSMDASSNFCSKPIKVANYDIIYAGAQKNVGTSGISVAIVDEARFGKAPRTTACPSVMDYSLLIKNNSLHNTIPVFPMYVTTLVAQHLVATGGIHAAEERASAKSRTLYDFIDQSELFECSVEKASRSKMNHCFRIRSTTTVSSADYNDYDAVLEDRFVSEATAAGLIGLKGHRSVGGCRASLYNAVTEEAVRALIDFMTAFEETNAD